MTTTLSSLTGLKRCSAGSREGVCLEDQPVENGGEEDKNTEPDEDHAYLIAQARYFFFCQLLLHLVDDRHNHAEEEDDYR